MDWKQRAFEIAYYNAKMIEEGTFDQAVIDLVAGDTEGERERFLEGLLKEDDNYHELVKQYGPIVIFVGDMLCYGVIDNFARCLGDALERLGRVVLYYDLGENGEEGLAEFAGKEYAALIGMQSYLFSIRLKDGSALFDKVRGKKINFVFDHPAYFRNHFFKAPADYLVLTPDRNYAEYIKRYYKLDARFLPPAGAPPVEEVMDQKARPYSVTFLGSYLDGMEEKLTELRRSGDDIGTLADVWIERMKAKLPEAPEVLLWEVLDEKSPDGRIWKDVFEISTDSDFEEFYADIRWIPLMLAHVYRERVIDALIREGIPVQVYGDTWKKAPFYEQINLIVSPELIGAEASKEYDTARVALNVMTWHKDGFTERLANAMLRGAVVATDETKYVRENFTDEEDMVIFPLHDLDETDGTPECVKRIKDILSDDERRERIAAAGHKKAMESHTWDVRARQLLELLPAK
jgi:glycosyltransferase involved in cell wall biosynthesis